jgi:hypothetical protein
VTQQQLLDRAAVVDKHIPSAFWPPVSALVSWSAFNAGMAKTGVGLVAKLATKGGWDDLRSLLGVDSYDATEAGALSLTAAAVTTSIDLAAAAALRLAGAKPSGSQEFSMTTFTSNKKLLAAHPLSPALNSWATAVRGSAEWNLLKKCRNQVVHSMVPRSVVYGSSGAARLPSSEVKIDGKDHPMDVLVQTFSAFGETTFGKFCDAVLIDFPNRVR